MVNISVENLMMLLMLLMDPKKCMIKHCSKTTQMRLWSSTKLHRMTLNSIFYGPRLYSVSHVYQINALTCNEHIFKGITIVIKEFILVVGI